MLVGVLFGVLLCCCGDVCGRHAWVLVAVHVLRTTKLPLPIRVLTTRHVQCCCPCCPMRSPATTNNAHNANITLLCVSGVHCA